MFDVTSYRGMKNIGDWQEKMSRSWILIQNKVGMGAGHPSLVTGHSVLWAHSWSPPQTSESQCGTRATASTAHLPAPVIINWICLCSRLPTHHSHVFMPHVLSIWGKRWEKEQQPCVMVVKVSGGFWASRWRNNGLLLEIWLCYVCSGRHIWRKALGIDAKSSLTL